MNRSNIDSCEQLNRMASKLLEWEQLVDEDSNDKEEPSQEGHFHFKPDIRWIMNAYMHAYTHGAHAYGAW